MRLLEQIRFGAEHAETISNLENIEQSLEATRDLQMPTPRNLTAAVSGLDFSALDSNPSRGLTASEDGSVQQNRPRGRPVLPTFQAKQWTSVAVSDDAIAHLISLFFTWEQPLHQYITMPPFLADLKEPDPDPTTPKEFCSPLLVNAICARACVSGRFDSRSMY